MNESTTLNHPTNELVEHAARHACDQEYRRTPLPDEILPEIEPQQSWSCSEGCGACDPLETQQEYFKVTDLITGEVKERLSFRTYVSSCCLAGLELWDDYIEDIVEFSLSGPDGPKSLKG